MKDNGFIIFVRILTCCAGSVFVGTAMAIMSFGNAGADPVTSLIIGISKTFKMTEGTASFLLNLIFFMAALIFCRKCIGIATITSIIIIGPSMDFSRKILSSLFPCDIPYWGGLAFLLFGAVLLGAAVGVYLSTGMGSSPSDSMMLLIHMKLKVQYRYASWIVFAVCMLIAVVLGEFPQLGTILSLLTVGASCDFIIRMLNRKPGKLFQTPKQPELPR